MTNTNNIFGSSQVFVSVIMDIEKALMLLEEASFCWRACYLSINWRFGTDFYEISEDMKQLD